MSAKDTKWANGDRGGTGGGGGLRGLVALMGAAALSGCAVVSDLGATGLAENIETNATTLNDAHTRAMTAIIALNVLRARDRWPTNYTTLSGIKSNPTLALNGSMEFGPLGLGNAPLPFSGSSATVARNEMANAEYSVNPFANNDRTQSLLKPVGPTTLLNYWESGWPRETLMWMFVDAVRFTDQSAFVFVNGDDFSDPAPDPTSTPQRFLKLIEDAHDGRVEFGQLDGVSQDERGCVPYDPDFIREAFAGGPGVETSGELVRTVEALTGKKLTFTQDNRTQVPPGEASTRTDQFRRSLLLCDSAPARWGFTDVTTGQEVAEIRTRSFDDMIYFLGETLRLSENGDEGKAGGVTLFKTYAPRADVKFAVHVDHAGQGYFIAPQNPAKVIGAGEDQSGNVLGLLNQLYQFAQSDEFLRAPEARLR
ncbi:MAG: hypothetical protein R3C52_07635 [Hyphomonadaceae bacterium]